ncbi:MAG: hypothetical protein Q9M91_04545 [Candidatus Dojkabacteria bacterium]|nr:hypothetical protein [Candidatus Dojkabacteria bacterium]
MSIVELEPDAVEMIQAENMKRYEQLRNVPGSADGEGPPVIDILGESSEAEEDRKNVFKAVKHNLGKVGEDFSNSPDYDPESITNQELVARRFFNLRQKFGNDYISEIVLEDINSPKYCVVNQRANLMQYPIAIDDYGDYPYQF